MLGGKFGHLPQIVQTKTESTNTRAWVSTSTVTDVPEVTVVERPLLLIGSATSLEGH